jgi:hypothetical protein
MINTKNHKTATGLATAALVAVIVVGIVTLGNEYFVSAHKMNKNDTDSTRYIIVSKELSHLDTLTSIVLVVLV